MNQTRVLIKRQKEHFEIKSRDTTSEQIEDCSRDTSKQIEDCRTIAKVLNSVGVVIDRSGKSSEQCILAARKANTVLGMIKRNISFKSKDVIVRLYKALVRPRLEFCVQAWCLYLRKDIAMIEKVQRRATKSIEGLRDISYFEHLFHT